MGDCALFLISENVFALTVSGFGKIAGAMPKGSMLSACGEIQRGLAEDSHLFSLHRPIGSAGSRYRFIEIHQAAAWSARFHQTVPGSNARKQKAMTPSR